ncbi:Fpg/Nei family DNA glycosylase [Actinoalloteichus hymeniacidonis]|uniref:DNA-(apurinic or apyrimidinic site) lyase n=1 Tax=Actinoalloteichus hymeniacidonis TaxID=340345 RepID=A0AAC9HNE0_9PSEU|nr:DNA-formamidopyrimidine glycosylase family protein [Actinoalloteichus hymeniacidonis]AOS62409.1 formamidopyrimidine-DNA glycosylase [Actinoalloteichus hymeniacidonis]MBB5909560.1 endonuclease-8 [Actinoalloteichus hymeniacidonis]
MPEGHTLHRLALLHHRLFAGRPVSVSSPQGRFAAEAALLDGTTMIEAQAHGKHLLHTYDGDRTVHIHLGLYGTFVEYPKPVTEPVGQVRMRLIGADHFSDLRGPTACRILNSAEVAELQARLGPDPLRSDADPDLVFRRISRSRSSIAALLLDQSILSGVGNVYRAEVLFRHNIPPMLPGAKLGRESWDAIWTDLVFLMGEGVRVGRIDTVRPEHDPSVTGRAPRQDRHGGEVYVYRRAGMPCLICGTTVLLTELQGRKLYWCPDCQPE